MEFATRGRVEKLLRACEVAFMVVGSHAAHYAFQAGRKCKAAKTTGSTPSLGKAILIQSILGIRRLSITPCA